MNLSPASESEKVNEVDMIATVTHFLVLATLILAMLVNTGCAVQKNSQALLEPADSQEYLIDKPDAVFQVKSSLVPSTADDSAMQEYDEPLAGPLPEAKIVIHKNARRLKLFSGKALVREYPIKIGKNPVGDKERQGDGRTPEGSFYICVKNPQSSYHLSLGLNYPTIEDAERGLRSNLITKSQYNSIVKRVSKGGIPPWNTPLGGEIFIHGEAEIWDWTYGCVAMNNRDIEELFNVIPVGTKVEIKK